MKYEIRAGDVELGGSVAAKIKTELMLAGVDDCTARRAGIVAFEAEMNLIVYSDDGGTLSVEVTPEEVILRVVDKGPGIEDLELAMTPGYSTAPGWATDLGFGAGMGLVNMKKHADRFDIESRVGEGTKICCRLDRDEEHCDCGG